MKTIAIARSRERTALTVVEFFDEPGQRERLRVVQHAERLPAESSPEEQYERLLVVSADAQSDNRDLRGSWVEPKVRVLQTATGEALLDILRYEHRLGHRKHFAIAASVSGTADSRSHIDPNRLMAGFYNLWRAGRIKIAEGISDREHLRRQLAGFRPTETKSGRLELGAELSQYDDIIVSLALATFGTGYGEARYIDSHGDIRRPGAVVGRVS